MRQFNFTFLTLFITTFVYCQSNVVTNEIAELNKQKKKS